MDIVQSNETKCKHPWAATITQLDDDGDYVVCTVCCERMTRKEIFRSWLAEERRLSEICANALTDLRRGTPEVHLPAHDAAIDAYRAHMNKVVAQ